jgi:hypothetical protein
LKAIKTPDLKMIQITLTTTEQVKNPNTKTSYKTVSTETKNIDSRQHHLITNDDTCKWFRRLGGSESKTMGYTCDGYKCVKLISTSPNKEIKKIREFDFKYTN